MSQHVRKYFPNYQLRHGDDEIRSREVCFEHEGVYFSARMPFFGTTETQKAALRWASYHTPPVICVSHEAPVAPDRDSFSDPQDLHRRYSPYVMAIATIECFGEKTPRKIKIYFCDVCFYEHNAYNKAHTHTKGVYIVEMDAEGIEILPHPGQPFVVVSLPPPKIG